MSTGSGSPPRIAVYSGSFDPITRGHEDLLRRAALLFDGVIVAVAAAHHKKTLFALTQRLELVRQALADLPSVQALPFDGLIMDFCRQHAACAVVRGIRNLSDFDYETQMAGMNRKLAPQIDTVMLAPDAQWACVSSTLVREIAKLGGDVSGMVSPSVAAALRLAAQAQ